MVTSNRVLEIIKKIIEKRYSSLMVSAVGKESLTYDEMKHLRSQGIQVPNSPSLIELAYLHNLLIPKGIDGPTSVEDMKSHQKGHKPTREEIKFAKEHSNQAMKQAIEKLKQDSASRILRLIRENNQNYKFNALKNTDQTEEVQKLVKESTLGKLKQKLRDTSGDANRDWSRVAVTEVAHAISMGSADRILTENEGNNIAEVYVYKIPVNDSALCAKCREFYLDSDGSPKVYTMSYLLSTGSNYGKKRSEWLPTVGPAHPNDRESGIIELKHGWKVLPGGRQTYVGLKDWNQYIINKVQK